jgi:hypothetical protein
MKPLSCSEELSRSGSRRIVATTPKEYTRTAPRLGERCRGREGGREGAGERETGSGGQGDRERKNDRERE